MIEYAIDMGRAIGAAVAGMLIAGCGAPSRPAPVPVPRPAPPAISRAAVPVMITRAGSVLVPVNVGGDPSWFALDTGSSATVIDAGVAARLGMTTGDAVAIHTKGGLMAGAAEAMLPALMIGMNEYHDMRVVVMDLAEFGKQIGTPIVGILGDDVLAQHDVVIDLEHGQLQLHLPGKIASSGVTSGMIRLPLHRGVSGLPEVAVTLGHLRPIPALVDLGSQRSVINSRAAARLGLHRPARDCSTDDCESAESTDLMRIGRVGIGELELQHRLLIVDDLPVFARLGHADHPAMILGADMLHGRTVMFDFQAGYVYLSR